MIAEDTLKHIKQAMTDLTTKKESQQNLKEAIFNAMKDLEASGKYNRNDPITREGCEPLVDEFVMHAKNWVKVK